jgi:hypothetical protein
MGTAQLGMAGTVPISLLTLMPWGNCNCSAFKRHPVTLLG